MAGAYEKAKAEARAVAQKQLEIDLSVVSSLVDTNWADFHQQIKTCVFRNEHSGTKKKIPQMKI